MYLRSLTALLFSCFLVAACSETEVKTDDSSSVPAAKNDNEGQVSTALPSGSTVLQAGTGMKAKTGDVVNVHYTGWVQDETAAENKGKEFDSSRTRGRPFVFTLGAGQVIKGWEVGVTGMQVGEQRRLVIPPEQGYGDRGVPGVIPPAATLIFDVELLKIGQ